MAAPAITGVVIASSSGEGMYFYMPGNGYFDYMRDVCGDFNRNKEEISISDSHSLRLHRLNI